MSITQEIFTHVNDGNLILVTPKVRSEPSLRKLYLLESCTMKFMRKRKAGLNKKCLLV